MKTVAELIIELNKFPQDAKCFAYEGEVIGIVVEYNKEQGVIYCSESDDHEITEVVPRRGKLDKM